MRIRRLASVLIFATAFAGCPASELPTTALPGGLDLPGLTTTQQRLVRATLAISGGALNETELVLGDDLTTVSGTFDVGNVAARAERELTLRVYGRFAETSDEVLLGRLVKPVVLEPRSDVEIAFSADDVFDSCGAVDGACDLVFDANRNGVKNIDDLLERERSGGRGIDPAAQPASLVTSEQVQFPSGVRLGSFARQLIVLENLGSDAVDVTEAAVIGGQGFAISILDPTGLSVAPPGRVLDGDAFATIAPGQEAFLAVSFSPVNAFVTTGAVFVRLKDRVSLVEQTVRVKLIANPEGELRPADVDYVAPDLAGLASNAGVVAVTAFPNAELHNGDALIAEELLPAGLVQTGATLTFVDGDDEVVFPVDAAFAVDVAAGERFSSAIDGLNADVDLAVVVVDDAGNGIGESVGLACAACRSANAGTSPEAVEFKNDGVARRVVVLLGRVEPADDADDGDDGDDSVDEGALTVAETVPFRLTTTVSAGPEFADVDPLSPTTGPLEGGIPIVVRGSGFHPRARVRVGGVDALDVAIVRSTDDAGVDVDTVRFTLPASSGIENPASIIVENPVDGSDGQAATLLEAFTYQPPAPVIEAVSPDVAPTTGGTVPVTIVGRFFSTRFGPPQVSFDGVVVDATFESPSRLRVTPPPAVDATVADEVELRVRNRVAVDVAGAAVVGSPSNGVDFHYVVPAGPAPTVTSVSPSTASIDGGAAVLIDGTGLRDGVVVVFGTRAALCLPLISATRVSCRVPASDVAGLVDVVVVNDDGQSGVRADAFTYTIPAPTVASVFPSRGSSAGGTLVVVEGGGFRDGVAVTFTQGEIVHPAAAVTRVGTTTLLVTTPAGATGTSTMTIRNPDAQTVTTTFTYAAPNAPAPSIRSLSPASGDIAGGTPLVISGTDFVDTAVVFGQTRLAVTNVVDRVSPALDELTVTVPAATTAGTAIVQVLNADGQSATATYTYTTAPVLGPRIDRVTPSTFTAGTPATFSVEGVRFATGVRVFIGGRAATITTASSTQIAGTFDGLVAAGSVLLVVENPDGGAVNAAITVAAPPTPQTPIVTGVSTSDVHADVAGDVLTVFGDHLDEGTLTATVGNGGPTLAARVTGRGRNLLTLELPALPSSTSTATATPYALSLQFATSTGGAGPATTSTTLSIPLQAHRPLVIFSDLDGEDDSAAELTLFGDFFNVAALDVVEFVSGTTRLLCTITTATERAIVCTADISDVAIGETFVPTLTWRGTFNGARQAPFALTGDQIGVDGVVSASPNDVGAVLVAGLTDYAELPQTFTVAVPGLTPAALTSSPRLVAPSVAIDASVVAEADGVRVTLNTGFVLDGSAPFTIELDDGVIIATGSLQFVPRTIGSDPAVRAVVWSDEVSFSSVNAVAGDETRVIARRVGPSAVPPVIRPLPAERLGDTITVTSTALLAPGPWEVCFSDQAEVCERSSARVDVIGVTALVEADIANGMPFGETVRGNLGPDQTDRWFFFVETDGFIAVDFNGCGNADALLTTGAGIVGDLCTQATTFPVARGEHTIVISGAFTEYSFTVAPSGPPVGFCNPNGVVELAEQCDEPNVGEADCVECIEGAEADDALGADIGIADTAINRTLGANDVDRFRFRVEQPGNVTVTVVNREGTGCFDAIGDATLTGPGAPTPVQRDQQGCIAHTAVLTPGDYTFTLLGTATPLKYRLEVRPGPPLPCGNGVLDAGEQCDDGILLNGFTAEGIYTDSPQTLCQSDCTEVPPPPLRLQPVFNVGRTITPGDVELITVQVFERKTLNVFTTLRVGDAAVTVCDNRIRLTIRDPQNQGVNLTTSVDGDGGCAFASAVVEPGFYTAVVSATNPADLFAFHIGAFDTPAPPAAVCGDGILVGAPVGPATETPILTNLSQFGGLGAGVAVADNGFVYAVQNENGRSIKRRTLVGIESQIAFSAGGKGADLEIGPDGFLYLADGNGLGGPGGNAVLRIAPATGVTTPFITSGVANPTGLAFGDDGFLYVSSFDDEAIVKFDAVDGGFEETLVPSLGFRPLDLELGPDGRLYVAGFPTGGGSLATVFVVDLFDGSVTPFATGFEDPHSLAFDAGGNLIVSDYNGKRLVSVDPFGVATTIVALDVPDRAPNGFAVGREGTLDVLLNDKTVTRFTNAVAIGTEECDDDGTVNGDGCSAQCRDEGDIGFGAPNTITKRGTPIGQPQDDDCDRGSVLVGVATHIDDGVASVAAICERVFVDDDFIEIVRPYTLAARGVPIGTQVAARCPPGTAVTGYSGNSDTEIEALTMTCAPLTAIDNVVGVGLDSGTSATVGVLEGTPFVSTPCGPGKVAMGISVNVSAAVNAFGLRCGVPE